jgi:hypothetical protein
MSIDTKEVDEFASGYAGAEVPVTAETLENSAEGLVVDVDAIAPKVDDAAGDTPAVVAADPPKMREISEDEYALLMKAPDQIATMREEFSRKLDSAFGKIGSTEQLLKTIQSSTPRGQIPKLTKEDLGKMNENYEYMSEDLLDVLNNMLGKLEGTASGAATVDPSLVSSLVNENLNKVLPDIRKQVREEIARETEEKAVLKKHKDAKQLFGTPEVTAFLATLPEDEQRVLNDPVSGWEAENVIAFLDKFKAAKNPPKAPPSNVTDIARKTALKAIVNPTGSGGTPQKKGEEDEFAAGYQSSQAK